MNDPLLRLRAEFPSLEDGCHLISHSLGAMPRGARTGLEQYADEWSGRSVRAWEEGWWELPRTVGDELALLLGAAPGTVVLQPNATLAGAVFLSALDFDAPRDGLVTTSLDFPSLLYMYRGLADRGARLVEVPSEDGLTIDTGRLLDAIDERTRVVTISHVLFRSAFVMDVAAVAERAREVGAMVVLDLYQSAGTLPLDLAGLGVDAAFGGCLKWLCGGPGNAYLYVRPDRIPELRPRLTGWQAHADPFAFDGESFRPTAGIERFLTGTPPVSALRAARAGIANVAAAGLAAIREKSTRQTTRILDRCDAEGWDVRSPREAARRGGSFVLAPPDFQNVAARLIERGILIDQRPEAGIRIGPHFYNTDAEVDRALDAIAEIVAERSV
ncbi:MAG: aminotransferase class V-fold PLP-dependent enzyme [Gemmatimonadetes bacterium]|nr:aminotransferase class V-fold PLP-dependent enzyme [Gemmatimonadota bacterium]